MGKRGPKTKVNSKAQVFICEELSQGRMYKDICADLKMDNATIWRARQADKDFDDAFNTSRANGIWAQLEMAENALNDALLSGKKDMAIIADKVANHARWKAEKLLPAFQPVSKQEVKHENAQQVVVGWAKPEPSQTADETRTLRARIVPDAEKIEQLQEVTH